MIAHRVDRLVRRTRRYDDMTPGERAAAARDDLAHDKAVGRRQARILLQRGLDRGDDVERLAHAAGSVFAAGHFAGGRPHEPGAVAVQRRNIALRRRMQPHAHIHRGRIEHALVGRQQQRRGEIVGEAPRRARQKMRRRRRDDDEIGVARELDVAHLALVGGAEQIVVDALARKARERKVGDEFPRPRGHHDAHEGAALAQPPHEFERFIRRDPAADDEQNALGLEALRANRTRHPERPPKTARATIPIFARAPNANRAPAGAIG